MVHAKHRVKPVQMWRGCGQGKFKPITINLSKYCSFDAKVDGTEDT
jgi:hypothetical protein